MDLPLVRLRQISDAIYQRRYIHRNYEESLLVWHTKVIAGQLVGLARSKKTAASMAKAAQGIRLRDHRERVRSESYEGWTPGSPIDPDDPRWQRNAYSRMNAMMDSPRFLK